MDYRKKTTTTDIAELAGVSQSTVSKILSQKSENVFSEETIRRVQDAAAKLNYSRKRNFGDAGKKIQNTRKLLGVLCPNITNPHYSMIVQSIEQSAYRAGYRIFICNTYRDVALEEDYLSQLQAMRIEGIIYAFLPNAVEKASEISKTIPMVIIGDKNENIDIDTLELDSFKSGNLIAKHLIELGHKDIAFVSTTLNQFNPPRTRRLQGVQSTMESYGLKDRLIVSSKDISIYEELDYISTEYVTGYQLTQEMIQTCSVTAFIGVNDMVSYGIMDALIDLSYSIPDDYSVCGFDNNFPSDFKRISLTTVDHYITYKGNNAFDILLRKILQNEKSFIHPHVNPIIKVEYTPSLIIRKSTGIPRTHQV